MKSRESEFNFYAGETRLISGAKYMLLQAIPGDWMTVHLHK